MFGDHYTRKTKRGILCSKINLALRKKLVKYFICSVLFIGSDTWEMRKRDKNRIEALEIEADRRNKVDGYSKQ